MEYVMEKEIYSICSEGCREKSVGKVDNVKGKGDGNEGSFL
jgi:hypothetical protein